MERDLVAEIGRRRPDATPSVVLLIAAVFITAARTAIQSWVDDGEHGELTEALARGLAMARIEVPTG